MKSNSLVTTGAFLFLFLLRRLDGVTGWIQHPHPKQHPRNHCATGPALASTGTALGFHRNGAHGKGRNIVSFSPFHYTGRCGSDGSGHFPSRQQHGNAHTSFFRLQASVTDEETSKKSRYEARLDQKWNAVVDRVLKYKEKHGHTRIPKSFDDGETPRLGRWVTWQRHLIRSGIMDKGRLERLKLIGFEWEKKETVLKNDLWEETFQRLVAYKKQHGTTLMKSSYNDGGSPALGNWVRQQIRSYNDGRLSKERIQKLNSIGFVWEDRRKDLEQCWMENLEELKCFQRKFNSTLVPNMSSPGNPFASLGTWTDLQRQNFHSLCQNKTVSGEFSIQKIEMLNATNFQWSRTNKSEHDRWLHEYSKLYDYYVRYNTTIVSNSKGLNQRFVSWVREQRREYHLGKLDQGKINLLNEIFFDWDFKTSISWDERFAELQAYYEKHGSTLLNRFINRELAAWTSEQRKLQKQGKLDHDRVAKLNSLGFQWDVKDEHWLAMFDRLMAYARKYGNLLVPAHFTEDQSLANWIGLQRKLYGHYFNETDILDEELLLRIRKKESPTVVGRIHRLYDAGFQWSQIEAQWMEVFQRLVRYQRETNSALVPYDYEDDPELGTWVHKQRYKANNGTLKGRRIHLLNSIGFVWDPMEDVWNRKFNRLRDFKSQFGHTRVPYNGDDPQLGQWVYTQRVLKKRGLLSADRIKRLDSISFVWQVINIT